MPSTWDPTTLAIIDELMIALDPAVMDSLSPKYLVSALPYILLNKTFHDNHYDSFPGFVGKVHFSEVRHFESLTQVYAEERFLTKTSWSTGCCSWHWSGRTLAGDKFAVIFLRLTAVPTNLHILARNCTPWQDETGPGDEKLGVTTRRCVPARKISEFFLTRICTAQDIDKPPRLSGFCLAWFRSNISKPCHYFVFTLARLARLGWTASRTPPTSSRATRS